MAAKVSPEAVTSLFVAILASPIVYQCLRRQKETTAAPSAPAPAAAPAASAPSPAAEASATDTCCGGEDESACGCSAPKSSESSDGSEGERPGRARQTVSVLHASLTGTAKGFAGQLAEKINADTASLSEFDAVARDLGEYSDSAGADIEDQLQAERVVVFVLATYEGGVAPGRSAGFVHWLVDFSNDFRVNKKMLAGVRFAVFGCGNSDYDKNFNAVAKAVTNSMLLLGAQQLHTRGDGDDSLNMGTQFAQWQDSVLDALDGSAGPHSSALAARRASAAGKQHPAVGTRSRRRAKGADGGAKGEVRLPLKEYRRQKRLAKERAAAELAAAEGYGSSSAEDSGGSGTSLRPLGVALTTCPVCFCELPADNRFHILTSGDVDCVRAMQGTRNGWM